MCVKCTQGAIDGDWICTDTVCTFPAGKKKSAVVDFMKVKQRLYPWHHFFNVLTGTYQALNILRIILKN